MTIPLFSREGSFPPALWVSPKPFGHALRTKTLREPSCSWGKPARLRCLISCPLSPAFIDKINSPISLNAVNLQLAAYEVFYVHS
jgi:hypothetical protein